MGVTQRSNRITTLLLIMLLIPFLSIYGVRSRVQLSAYQAWQIVSMLIFFVLLHIVISKISLNWAIRLFCLYQAVIFLSTFIHHGFSPGILVVTVAGILLFILLQTGYYFEIISAFSVIVVLAVLINLPIMLTRRSEEYAVYFIGGKNSLSMFLIPGAFLLMIRSLELKGKIVGKTWLVIGICIVSVLLGSSGTGLVVAALAAGLMLVVSKFKPKKKIFIIGILAVYVLFILLPDQFFETQIWIEFTELLGKDSDLTSRTVIWNIAKDIIEDNWLFGTGRGTEIFYINKWGQAITITEAHNFVLEILMEGGVVALAIYTFFFGKIVKHLDMSIPKNRVIFVALCVVLLNGLTESTLNNFFVTVILGIACRYAEENQGRKERNEQQI